MFVCGAKIYTCQQLIVLDYKSEQITAIDLIIALETV